MHSAGGDPIPDQAKEAVLRQHPSHLTRLLPFTAPWPGVGLRRCKRARYLIYPTGRRFLFRTQSSEFRPPLLIPDGPPSDTTRQLLSILVVSFAEAFAISPKPLADFAQVGDGVCIGLVSD
jgi:hypothetical protein